MIVAKFDKWLNEYLIKFLEAQLTLKKCTDNDGEKHDCDVEMDISLCQCKKVKINVK